MWNGRSYRTWEETLLQVCFGNGKLVRCEEMIVRPWDAEVGQRTTHRLVHVL